MKTMTAALTIINSPWRALWFLIISTPVWGFQDWRVTKIEGHVFVRFPGKTVEVPLTVGIFIPADSTISTQTDGQVSIQGPKGSLYHVSANSLSQWKANSVALEKGSLWVQQLTANEEENRWDQASEVTTVNSQLNFTRAEFIVKTHESPSNTETIVISGRVKKSNLFLPEKKEVLISGEYSVLKQDYLEGRPQVPRLVATESLLEHLKDFHLYTTTNDSSFKELMQILRQNTAPGAAPPNTHLAQLPAVDNQPAGRAIASAPDSFTAPKRFYTRKAAGERKVVVVSPLDKIKVRIWSAATVKSAALATTTPIIEAHRVPAAHESKPIAVEQPIEPSSEYDLLLKELKHISPLYNESY